MGVTCSELDNLPVGSAGEVGWKGSDQRSGRVGKGSSQKKLYIKFFIQDMACAVDYNGKLLLEEKGRLAASAIVTFNGFRFNQIFAWHLPVVLSHIITSEFFILSQTIRKHSSALFWQLQSGDDSETTSRLCHRIKHIFTINY